MPEKGLSACRICPNRTNNLTREQRKAAEQGGHLIAFDNQNAYIVKNRKTANLELDTLETTRPELADAVKGCDTPQIVTTPRTDRLGQRFGLKDDVYHCGAIALLEASAEETS